MTREVRAKIKKHFINASGKDCDCWHNKASHSCVGWGGISFESHSDYAPQDFYVTNKRPMVMQVSTIARVMPAEELSAQITPEIQ